MEKFDMYALKHVEFGKLMQFTTSSSDGDLCEDVIFTLREYGEGIWVTHSQQIAENAAITISESYNASFNTPINDYVGKLKVVKLKEEK
jgi:hypothetical protein